MTKAENELAMSNEILGIVQNLDDVDEAKEYVRLYIKAQKKAVKEAGEEYDFDDDEVIRLVSETDSRFIEMSDEEKEEFKRERRQEEQEHNEMLSELEPGKGMY